MSLGSQGQVDELDFERWEEIKSSNQWDQKGEMRWAEGQEMSREIHAQQIEHAWR